MFQVLADHIDQLDLTLDQLAMRDRNFDRFALMLVDNVVELTLHRHAQDRAYRIKASRHLEPDADDSKLVSAALGQHFEAKVKLARSSGLLSGELAESVQYLHRFRNVVYHTGMRHEAILHALALFYFDIACTILSAYEPPYWSWASNDRISHRALKYLGKPNVMHGEATFRQAWARLRDVATSMGDTLIQDLHADMEATITTVDEQIDFLASEDREGRDRKRVVVSCQTAPFAFSVEGRAFAASHSCPEQTVGSYLRWMEDNYKPPVPNDPIPGWRKRSVSLKTEDSRHGALKKYCEFMAQTEDFRGQVDESAAQLNQYIQQQIDIARGK